MDKQSPLQLWGGVECTVNRVGNKFFNQLKRSGHWDREGDLELFASLGLRTLRFPLPWELLAPNSPSEVDWSWADARLERARQLGIRPIVGLLHHGCGPGYTHLLHRRFAEEFGAYAAAVASRYPWIDAFTPINEPLTTARFSALYGHWYPHARGDGNFARAFLHQCRATVLAMRAIRESNPSAQLVQTEDLGETSSTPALSYQAAFENKRRWLTWDLLRGEIDRDHPLWSYFKWAGIGDAELEIFREEPCPPDLLGINYQVTSERFLDDNVSIHPPENRGGNGRDVYADIAVVHCAQAPLGADRLLIEAWERYQTPLAITETHVRSTADDQLRWFMDVWDVALSARRAGVDVMAVTAWSLLGSFDWDTLVTKDRGYYEPGVFDVSRGEPRPTVLAPMVQSLATSKTFESPLLATPSWWRRDHFREQHCA